MKQFKSAFSSISNRVASAMGSPYAFISAALIVVIWGVSGPFFHFSDTWQLVINTGTTVITFLMVFVVQNTQNRDATAMHIKVDELLRAVKNARTGFVDIEHLSAEELEKLQQQFTKLKQTSEEMGEVIEDIQEVTIK